MRFFEVNVLSGVRTRTRPSLTGTAKENWVRIFLSALANPLSTFPPTMIHYGRPKPAQSRIRALPTPPPLPLPPPALSSLSPGHA